MKDALKVLMTPVGSLKKSAFYLKPFRIKRVSKSI